MRCRERRKKITERVIKMSNNKKHAVDKETAKTIYQEVAAIISNHTTSGADNSRVENIADDITALFSETYGVNTAPSKPFDDYTWAEIAEIAERGEAVDIFSVGDFKTVTLYTGEIIKVVILGFNHDTVSGTNAVAGITLGLRDMLDGEFEMNEQDTNAGGWDKSKMRNVYMPRFLKLLPAELQAVIKTVDKKTGAGGGSNKLITSHDKLFLFSQIEVDNDDTYTAGGEGKQYPYFEDEGNCVKKRGGSANAWWLRSPLAGYSNYFRIVISLGDVNYYNASNTYGVSFGFCI